MALKGIHYIYYGYQISPRLPLPVYHLWLSLMNHYQYRLYTLRLTIHLFFNVWIFTYLINGLKTIGFEVV